VSKVTIEIAYGTPAKQTLVELTVEENTTVAQAIAESGILKQHPEIDIDSAKVGIWNKVVRSSTVLKQGDRIEIYRPLIADPKEVRKRRAERAVKEGRADKVTGGRPSPLRAQDKN
jgi:putative ubiquitin-RnfH superfamily antitoxin RatB of RatAB toxin-antitoxin module